MHIKLAIPFLVQIVQMIRQAVSFSLTRRLYELFALKTTDIGAAHSTYRPENSSLGTCLQDPLHDQKNILQQNLKCPTSEILSPKCS